MEFSTGELAIFAIAACIIVSVICWRKKAHFEWTIMPGQVMLISRYSDEETSEALRTALSEARDKALTGECYTCHATTPASVVMVSSHDVVVQDSNVTMELSVKISGPLMGKKPFEKHTTESWQNPATV